LVQESGYGGPQAASASTLGTNMASSLLPMASSLTYTCYPLPCHTAGQQDLHLGSVWQMVVGWVDGHAASVAYTVRYM
jgi:hypothetical protein